MNTFRKISEGYGRPKSAIGATPRSFARLAEKGAITVRRAIPATYPSCVATPAVRAAIPGLIPKPEPSAASAAARAVTVIAVMLKASRRSAKAQAIPTRNVTTAMAIIGTAPGTRLALPEDCGKEKLTRGKITHLSGAFSSIVAAFAAQHILKGISCAMS
jgi:hypothetical protein